MVDTLEGAASGSAAADTDAGQNGSSDPDIDLDELRAATSQAGSEAALQTTITDLKRAAGHIPGLQKSLGEVTARLARLDAVEASNKQLAESVNALISALPDGMVPAGVLERLRVRPSDSDSQILQKLQGLEDRINAPAQQSEQQTETPEQAAWRGAWDTATQSVFAYAERQGYTGQIPDSEWRAAMGAHPTDPAAAAMEVARYIDRQKAAGSQQERRAERQDASQGATSSRAGGSSGAAPLTLDALRKMSVDEVRKYPQAEVMRVLATG